MRMTFDKTRLEAFSDGVIAVIITIMVLELKVPQGSGWGGPDGLRSELPTIAVYAISFFFVGTYWMNHHFLIHRVDRADSRVLWANLFFLFLLSLVPFFTSYVEDKHLNSLSVFLYAAINLVVGFGFNLLRAAVLRRLRVQGRIEQPDVAAERKHWGSLAVYAAALVTALWHPYIALALLAAVLSLWIEPTFGTQESERTHDAATGDPR